MSAIVDQSSPAVAIAAVASGDRRARPPGFFALQVGGWSLYFVLHVIAAWTDGQPLSHLFASLASALAGFALSTLIYRPLLRLADGGYVATALGALALSYLAAIPFAFVSETAYWLSVHGEWRLQEPLSYVGSAFWCGSILLTWCGVFLGARFYTEMHRARELALAAQHQASEARLRALRHQMSPHFVLNALNAISTLVLARRNDAALTTIEQLGELLRCLLGEAELVTTTVADELNLTQRYLAIEQIRFGDRLRVSMDVPRNCRSARLPSLLLQPLVENAIKHGIAPSPTGGDIALTMRLSDDCLQVVVSNSVVGESKSRGEAIGLRNLADRLQTLYPDRHRLHYALADGRFQVDIELPVEGLRHARPDRR